MQRKVICSCGAIYERTEELVIFRDHDRFRCVICDTELEIWSSHAIPRYRLIYDPRREEPGRRIEHRNRMR